MGKLEEYGALVKYVNSEEYIEKCNAGIEPEEISKGLELTACPYCNEINLWSYWEGGRNRLDADILVVGQDWGCIPGKTNFVTCLEDMAISGKQFTYKEMMGKDNYITDVNLGNLLEHLGCKSVNEDAKALIKETSNVFFANFVMGYRKGKGKATGGYRNQWTKASKKPFEELVKIIQPKVIICLGQKVYNGVRECANIKPINGGYVNYVIEFSDDDTNYKIKFADNLEIATFPVCHPGSRGIQNRCNAFDNENVDENNKKIVSNEIGLELQGREWEKIKQYLDSCD